MKNKIISGFCMFLIVFSVFNVVVMAEDVVVATYDLDGDGVCSKPISELIRSTGMGDEVNSETRGKLNEYLKGEKWCKATKYGDSVCPDTPRGRSVDTDYDSETSGCAPSELVGYYDYWSVDLKEARPKRVKLNWLVDQRDGVDVFQPFEFTPNFVVETREGRAGIDKVKFVCKSVKDDDEGNKVKTNYLKITRPMLALENRTKYMLRFTLRPFSQEELTEENILKIFDKRNIDGEDLEGIEIQCKSEIKSFRYEVDEKTNELKPERLGAVELDEFEIFVPLERLVFHPPEKALEAGIKLADGIIGALDKIVPKVEKVSRISRGICYTGIGLQVLAHSLLRWLEPFKEFADWFWDGYFHSDLLGSSDFFGEGENKKGLIGGKAFCRYYACPRQWCPFAMGLEEAKATASAVDKKWKAKSLPVQDSLVLSTKCFCFSGIYINLFKMKVILEEWKRCLEAARKSEQYSVYCEKYLSKYLCEEVIGEFMALQGGSLISRALLKVKDWGGRLLRRVVPGLTRLDEARRSKGATEGADAATGGLGQFYKEIEPITTADAKGNLGYKEGMPQIICEFAFYRKWPDFTAFERFKVQPIEWVTTILGNWNSRVAYLGFKKKEDSAVYEYEISWTIIAGNDNFKYRVSLEREGGGTLPITGHKYKVSSEDGDYTVNAGSGVLRKAGDLVADYIEIISDVQYDKLCFYMPSEVNEKQCFPPGGFDVGSPLDFGMFEEDIEDSDGDGLRDIWEERFNCMPGRTDYETAEDKSACEILLNEGKNNILNPNSLDSDGDGENDDKENPDRDAFTNYYEQQNNFHPNLPNKDLDGDDVGADCYIKFLDALVIADEVFRDKYKYDVGEFVKVAINWDGSDDMFIKGEVINTDVGNPYYDIKSVELSGVRKAVGFNLLKLKDDIKSGVYLLRLSLVKKDDSGLVSRFVTCTDPDTSKLASKEFHLIIQNPSEGGCVDSDHGVNYGVDGVCIDSTSINEDGCGVGGLGGNILTEWECRGDNCDSKTKDCGDNGLCDINKCIFDNCVDNDPSENFGFKGTCEYRDGGKKFVMRDYCLRGGNILYQWLCREGMCFEDRGSDCTAVPGIGGVGVLSCVGTDDFEKGEPAICA